MVPESLKVLPIKEASEASLEHKLALLRGYNGNCD